MPYYRRRYFSGGDDEPEQVESDEQGCPRPASCPEEDGRGRHWGWNTTHCYCFDADPPTGGPTPGPISPGASAMPEPRQRKKRAMRAEKARRRAAYRSKRAAYRRKVAFGEEWDAGDWLEDRYQDEVFTPGGLFEDWFTPKGLLSEGHEFTIGGWDDVATEWEVAVGNLRGRR